MYKKNHTQKGIGVFGLAVTIMLSALCPLPGLHATSLSSDDGNGGQGKRNTTSPHLYRLEIRKGPQDPQHSVIKGVSLEHWKYEQGKLVKHCKAYDDPVSAMTHKLRIKKIDKNPADEKFDFTIESCRRSLEIHELSPGKLDFDMDIMTDLDVQFNETARKIKTSGKIRVFPLKGEDQINTPVTAEKIAENIIVHKLNRNLEPEAPELKQWLKEDKDFSLLGLEFQGINNRDINIITSLQYLTSLNLSRNNINEAGAISIATSPYMKNLTDLNLASNEIGIAGVTAISMSPYMESLDALDLWDNEIGNQGAIVISKSSYMQNLTKLILGCNKIVATGTQSIATSPYMQNLTDLNLGNNEIGIQGVQSIATGLVMENLTSLNLSSSQLGNAGTAKIFTSKSLQKLITLRLSNNRISDEGAMIIANRPHMENLKILDLRKNQIGDMGQNLLKNRFDNKVVL